MKQEEKIVGGFVKFGVKGHMLVCIDNIIHAKPNGTLFNYYISAGLPYVGVEKIIFGINKICDTLDFPLAEFETRVLFEQPRRTGEGQMIVKVLYTSNFSQYDGKLATILIIVMFRRNGGLQGEIRLCESKYQHHKHFRNEMKLMYFLQEICVYAGSCAAKNTKNCERVNQEVML